MKLCKEFCKGNFNIKLVLNSFKIKNYFSNKGQIPDDLKSFLVYKCTCANCSSSYSGRTCRHFKTRIAEHIKEDNKSRITPTQHALTHIILSFKIIDKANSKFDLKIKEALYINWRKSNLNAQQNYVAIAFSLQLVSPLCSFVFVFAFVFLPFFIYCFNYLITSLFSFSLFSLFSILLF